MSFRFPRILRNLKQISFSEEPDRVLRVSLYSAILPTFSPASDIKTATLVSGNKKPQNWWGPAKTPNNSTWKSLQMLRVSLVVILGQSSGQIIFGSLPTGLIYTLFCRINYMLQQTGRSQWPNNDEASDEISGMFIRHSMSSSVGLILRNSTSSRDVRDAICDGFNAITADRRWCRHIRFGCRVKTFLTLATHSLCDWRTTTATDGAHGNRRIGNEKNGWNEFLRETVHDSFTN